jgi:hypothetical protein
LSWFKKEIVYVKNSFIDIIKGFIFFVLASSGFGIAAVLSYLGYNGTIITFFGLIVELISLVLCFLLFRGYLKPKEDLETSKSSKKII